MKTYFFKTTVTENSSDFWIDRDIVKNFTVSANSIIEAKNKYFDFVCDSAYINISKTQRTKAKKMYIDTNNGTCKQIGLVFTGSTDIEFNNEWKKRYVSLWCEIYELVNVF